MLRCYCSGDCPDNKLNGTCFAKPNSKCFAAVEEVFDADTNSFEKEFSYGCLPPEEATLMQVSCELVLFVISFLNNTYSITVQRPFSTSSSTKIYFMLFRQ